MSEEKCTACDGLTGRSGRGEDSLYLESSEYGPFCADCYEGAKWADASLTKLRGACNDAIELAQEGWSYEGEDGYFFKKWNVRERLDELRRRAGKEGGGMKAKCPDCPEKDGRIKFLREKVARLMEHDCASSIKEVREELFEARQSILREGIMVGELREIVLNLLKSSDASWYSGKHGGHDWGEAVDRAHLVLVKTERHAGKEEG